MRYLPTIRQDKHKTGSHNRNTIITNSKKVCSHTNTIFKYEHANLSKYDRADPSKGKFHDAAYDSQLIVV